MTNVRINLPEGVTYGGQTYAVVADTTDIKHARLIVTKHTGVAVADQGPAFLSGWISTDGENTGYALTQPERSESYECWIPSGASLDS